MASLTQPQLMTYYMAKPGPVPETWRIFAVVYSIAICEWTLRRAVRTAECAQVFENLVGDMGSWDTSRIRPLLLQAELAGLVRRESISAKTDGWRITLHELNMNNLTDYLVSRIE